MSISISDLRQKNNSYKNTSTPPNFKGGMDSVLNIASKGLEWCDKNPMYGVSVIDLTSMIGPRTLVDTIERNPVAGVETLARESSGLIINCLTPGFVVLGVAKAFNKFLLKDFKGIKGEQLWANKNSIEDLKNVWLSDGVKNNKDRVQEFVKQALGKVSLLGDDSKYVKLSDHSKFENITKKLADAIKSDTSNNLKPNKELISGIKKEIVDELKAARTLKYADKDILLNIEEFVRDTYSVGKAFTKVADDKIPAFTKQLGKLVNIKSGIGLLAVCAVASSVQYINRAITKKRTGVDGFVGYKNFEKGEVKKMTPEEKQKFNRKKILSSLGMAGIAAFAMKPFNPLMFQFKGILPSLNQCRLISATTNVGRIMAASDDNELKETTFRDYLGFANLYLLGDFAAKGTAAIIEKVTAKKGNPVKLLNRKEILEPGAGILKKLQNVKLKGFEEVAAGSRNYRALAEAAGLLYSMVMLGICVPKLNIYLTNKREAKRIENEGKNSVPESQASAVSMKGLSPQTQQIFSTFIKK